MLRRLAGVRTLAERYLERGLYHLDKEEYEDAIADLTAAIGQEPFDAELYTTRGFIYLEADDERYLEYARADFDYALYIDPEQWVAEYSLGRIAFAEGDIHEAFRRFTLARDRAPLRAEPYYYRALCYHKLDVIDRATAEMQNALDIFVEAQDSRRREAKRWLTQFKKDAKRLKKQQQESWQPPALEGRPSLVERDADS